MARKRREHIDPNQACPLRLRCRQKGHAMVIIGIDPHKGSHTAVVIDRDERVVDEIWVRTSKGLIGFQRGVTVASRFQLGLQA